MTFRAKSDKNCHLKIMLDNDERYKLADKRLIYTCKLFHFETNFLRKLTITDRRYKIADKRFGMVIAWLVILGQFSAYRQTV